jgi:RNA polymerase sigma-70 factor (ECF subfamily)
METRPAAAHFPELSDEELMFRVQDGDRRAFDALVGRYRKRLYNYLLRLLGRPDEAEEFAQETFVKAYVHAEKYRSIARFSTWLYTIATNLVRNQIRSRRRAPRMVSLWAGDRDNEGEGRWMDLEDPGPAPDADAERGELREAIQKAIEKIPPRYREAFVLREISHLTYEEIAAVTGVRLGTVRSRINRGRSHFRDALAPYLGREREER